MPYLSSCWATSVHLRCVDLISRRADVLAIYGQWDQSYCQQVFGISDGRAKQDSFLFFFPTFRGNEGPCKQWKHAFGAHKTSTHIWSASSQYTLFSLLIHYFALFDFFLKQQSKTKKKELRLNRHLLQRKKDSVDKRCMLNVPTRYLPACCRASFKKQRFLFLFSLQSITCIFYGIFLQRLKRKKSFLQLVDEYGWPYMVN